MNNARRREVKELIKLLNKASQLVSDILNDEECAFNNLNDSLQQTMRGEQMEENIDQLEETLEYIEESISCLEEVM